MVIPIAIIAILLAAAATVLVTANRRRSATGALDSRARRRDADSEIAAEEVAEATEIDDEARRRADETRAAAGAGVPAVPQPAIVTEWGPADEEELGVTRRQFLNRGILASFWFAVAAFGATCLAFIWPSGRGGFGGKIVAGNVNEILAEIADKKQPFYVPEARAYILPYPTDDVDKAKKVYAHPIVAGMEKGVVALYQKCPHLGCRVPWCQTSQWFECPCHGSKYNRVGEKRGGPAPRGMDRFGVEINGDTLVINTGLLAQGPPIGTDTTGQQPEGPACV